MQSISLKQKVLGKLGAMLALATLGTAPIPVQIAPAPTTQQSDWLDKKIIDDREGPYEAQRRAHSRSPAGRVSTPDIKLNQRQRRKRWSQTGNYKKR